MLDVNFIRQNPEKVKEGITAKNIEAKLVDKFLELDIEWRAKVTAIDHLRSEQNLVTGQLKKGKTSDLLSKAQILKKQLAELEKIEAGLGKERRETLSLLPNLPLDDVPAGKSDKENLVLREVGRKTKFAKPAKDYLTIAENLGIIDVSRAGKVSGSRFGYFLGGAALLEFALIGFITKLLSDAKFVASVIKEKRLKLKPKPFVPIITPVLIKKESMWGMGYLDRGADEIYHLEKDNLYLIGTSEQSIGPRHQGEVLEEKLLPLRYVGFSACFRREAGSYGKDTKGVLRVHQFDKLEMFSFVRSEDSASEHQLLLAIEEEIMRRLKIPYRVVRMCTGDLGDAAAAKFDVEAWLPGQNDGKGEYRETHSTSNTTDWQARRLNIKYRPAAKESNQEAQFVHMLNGTAAAIGRMIIAIIENYQTPRGTVKIPQALARFVNLKEIR